MGSLEWWCDRCVTGVVVSLMWWCHRCGGVTGVIVLVSSVCVGGCVVMSNIQWNLSIMDILDPLMDVSPLWRLNNTLKSMGPDHIFMTKIEMTNKIRPYKNACWY